MWDLRLALPFEGHSIRKILTSAALLLVACFAYIIATAPTTHAADASWNGDVITYNGQQYSPIQNGGPAYSPELPGGIQYRYVETLADGTQKAHIIYFENGTDTSKAKTAHYMAFTFAPPNKYTAGTKPTDITLDPKQESAPVTSCVVEGIGWIICPVTNFLADGMDMLFKVLSEFLKVQPLQTSSDASLYRLWSIMRNFANIAFVIGFLILIYSQITSIGISNYGIKKLLPRLIIAAILVNVSYWICAIAIDTSNITGYSLHDLLIGISDSVAQGNNNWDLLSWKSFATAILTGGTAVGAGSILAYTGVAATGGAIYMILPILLGVLLAALVALLVLAARQAIITIMVIISPLAMVAYLLPNTEKYFEKWRELFTTLLIMFPIFSVIFGGSQLAGRAIMQSAAGAGSFNLLLLGMAVQVAPIVVTPLLVRFSGSLLGRVAGMVNNPNKGLIDRTRKWSQDRAAEHKARVLANPNGRYNGLLGRGARSIDQKRRMRAGWQKTHESMADNLWHGSKAYEAIDEANREAERTKQIIEHHHETTWNNKVRIDPSSLEKELKVRLTADESEAAKKKLETLYQEAKTPAERNVLPSTFEAAGYTSASMVQMVNRSRDTALDLTREALRKQNADRALASMHNVNLKNNTNDQALLDRVGGVRGEQGANSAVAYAISEERKAFGVSSAEAGQLLRHFNPDNKSLQDFINGQELTITDDTGTTRTFKADDIYARDAAIEMQITEGPVKYAIEIASKSGAELRDYRTTIAGAWAKAGLSGKTSFGGGTTIDQIKSGYMTSVDKFMYGVVQDNIAKGKISPDVLATIDVDAVEVYVQAALAANKGDTVHMDAGLRGSIEPQLQAFSNHAWRALNDPLYKGRIKDNVRGELQKLIKVIPEDVTPEERAKFS